MTPVKGELVHASAIYTAITASFVSAVGTKSCYIMSKDVCWFWAGNGNIIWLLVLHILCQFLSDANLLLSTSLQLANIK